MQIDSANTATIAHPAVAFQTEPILLPPRKFEGVRVRHVLWISLKHERNWRIKLFLQINPLKYPLQVCSCTK